jgi:hypothetical protein
MKSAVYIGAGLDVRPVKALKNINKFIYIDCRPFTEHPNSKCNCNDKKFIDDFSYKMDRIDFLNKNEKNDDTTSCCRKKKIDINQVKFEYEKDNINLIYYFNTPFPSNNITDEIENELATSDTLIVAGFHPHKSIIDYMKKPIHLVCFEGTYYGNDHHEDDLNTIIEYLHNNPKCKDIADIVYYKKEYIKHSFHTIDDVEKYRKNILKYYP